jgi:hypothetical protein
MSEHTLSPEAVATHDEHSEQQDPPRSARRMQRARTISIKRLAKRDLEAGRLEANALMREIDEVDQRRPTQRSECLPGGRNEARPCPYVSCKQHLFLDVSERSGAIKINFPGVELWEMPATCALDVADRGGVTLEDVGAITNLVRERIRQIEDRGLVRLRASREGRELVHHLDRPSTSR